ncbi:MAG: hypothetical protein HLUCCA08_01670 [Rhodobacteraceae bacterium HLUCCA08]|nr:MAG: hypothetical protein HLUCCA08_01670 [Rhodobacteraceae bacterium HLUCCA08]
MFRKLTLATAATIALSGAAFAADSYIGFQGDMLDRGSVVTLDTVRAAGNGVIEIYDFHTAEQGVLLGSAAVNAGANSDVRVNLGTSPVRDVIAVLTVNGQVVDTFELDIAR